MTKAIRKVWAVMVGVTIGALLIRGIILLVLWIIPQDVTIWAFLAFQQPLSPYSFQLFALVAFVFHQA